MCAPQHGKNASLRIEECSKRIRALCTDTGVPASLLPSKKELIEMRKAKDLETLAKEAESSTQHQSTEVIPAATINQAPATVEGQSVGPAAAKENPASLRLKR
ncbi:hypothetical protein CDAR_74211 [Caerostris darwini]|uniref:Uncharacterized protein n=1 Tax=Caerostris darwini TaxID=1538125 RepID=A0AAV4PV38_9ARAC|nr:hypothetical protein CDAR_74211 [Caerostris darwini]